MAVITAAQPGITVFKDELTPITPSRYKILVPVANPATADELLDLATSLARDRKGEVVALHILASNNQLPGDEERSSASARRTILEQKVTSRRRSAVPIHTVTRIAFTPARGHRRHGARRWLQPDSARLAGTHAPGVTGVVAGRGFGPGGKRAFPAPSPSSRIPMPPRSDAFWCRRPAAPTPSGAGDRTDAGAAPQGRDNPSLHRQERSGGDRQAHPGALRCNR